MTIEFVLGFALAWLIWRFIERQRLLTTLLLVPMMLAPVAVGLIWRLLLQGDFGMVTYYLRAVGLLSPASAVFSSPGLVMPTIIAIDVWQWTPFVTLIMLAGLMSLPRSPFEAATMDGAGPWRQFVDIMLPLLRPIIALVLLLRGIDAFKEFDKVFIMTGGGPGTVSELLSIYAYRVNFKNWNLGYGAAVVLHGLSRRAHPVLDLLQGRLLEVGRLRRGVGDEQVPPKILRRRLSSPACWSSR